MMVLVSFFRSWLKRYGLLLGILLLALGLRLILLPYGLPLLFHEDEPIYYRRALQFGFGDWDPHYFKKPTFFLYFYFGFYYLFYLFSDFYQWDAFYKAFWQDPTRLALLGRSITVCFAVASVWLTYRLGKRALSKAVGLAAAFLLAVDFTHVKYSPIVISDIPALFCVLTTAWFAFSVYEKGRWRDYLACAAAIALAMSFKYNAFSVFFLLAAHCLRTLQYIPRERWYRQICCSARLWGAFGAIAFIFFVLNPYVLINLPTFWADLNLERQHMLLRTPTITTRHYSFMIGFDNIFFQILPKALGWPLYLLGGLGLLGSVFGYRKADEGEKSSRRNLWLLLSFPLGFLLVVSQFRLVNAKYLLPVIPCWFILAAYCLYAMLLRLKTNQSWMSKKRLALLYAVLMIGVSFPLWQETLKHVWLYCNPDTRTEARLYLDHHIPVGATVYVEPETLPLKGPVTEGGSAVVAKKEAKRGLYSGFVSVPAERAALVVRQPDYVVLRIKPRKGKGEERVLPYPPEYYHYVVKQYRLLKVFSPYPLPTSFQVESFAADFMGLYQSMKRKSRKAGQPGPFLLVFERDALRREK